MHLSYIRGIKCNRNFIKGKNRRYKPFFKLVNHMTIATTNEIEKKGNLYVGSSVTFM